MKKKLLLGVVGIIVLLIVIGALAGGDDKGKPTPTAVAPVKAESTDWIPTPIPTKAPATKAATATPKAPAIQTKPVATAPPAGASSKEVYYANCTEAKKAGAAPLYRGKPGYRTALDRDNDGMACE